MKACPVCRHDTLAVFFEIDQVPTHCNLLWPDVQSARSASRRDIRLGFCRRCGMVYNVSFDPEVMRYTAGYETSLHFSPHFQTYAQQLAERLITQYDLHGKSIIEIGCGQGEFLSLLCADGRNRGVGFDPSYDSRNAEAEGTPSITFVRDFYTDKHADYAADLICCRHVLEHVESPRDFLFQVRRAIGGRETIVFFEVPNVLYTLRDLGIWDIIYEHCSYFSPASLSRLFEECGFKVLSLEETYGGQFVCLEALPLHSLIHPPEDRADAIHAMELLVAEFTKEHNSKVRGWREHLARLGETSKRIVVWGAGSKGVTFLNVMKVEKQIEYVVDVNPRKQRLFVPGTGQQIVQPEALESYRPDTVIVMNPLYSGEIQRMATSMNIAVELLAA
jgi:SAM-dependent methyltransferase